MTRYPRAVKPNRALDSANVFALDMASPKLADDDWFVVSVNMKVGTYTKAHTDVGGDLHARNVIVTATAVGAADTMGTITVTGTNIDGYTISEVITPVAGSVVAGAKAFKTITSIVGAGWVIGEGNDTVKVGFGDLIGLPSSIRNDPGHIDSARQMFGSWLGGAPANTAFTWDADEIEKCTVDASASTYNGTKRLTVLLRR